MRALGNHTAHFVAQGGELLARGAAIGLRRRSQRFQLARKLLLKIRAAGLKMIRNQYGHLAAQRGEMLLDAAPVRFRGLPYGRHLTGEMRLQFLDAGLQSVGNGAVLLVQCFEFDGDFGLQFGNLPLHLAGMLVQAGVQRIDHGFEDLLIERMSPRRAFLGRSQGERALFHLGDPLLHLFQAQRDRPGIDLRGGDRPPAGVLTELHANAKSHAIAKCDCQASPDRRIATVLHIT